MKYAFSHNPIDGYAQRNPDFWGVSTPPADASLVLVDARFPEIANHFKDLGVEVATFGPGDTGPQPITREDIAKMPEAEVIEHLELHGVPDVSGKVDDLRARLVATMFVEA